MFALGEKYKRTGLKFRDDVLLSESDEKKQLGIIYDHVL